MLQLSRAQRVASALIGVVSVSLLVWRLRRQRKDNDRTSASIRKKDVTLKSRSDSEKLAFVLDQVFTNDQCARFISHIEKRYLSQLAEDEKDLTTFGSRFNLLVSEALGNSEEQEVAMSAELFQRVKPFLPDPFRGAVLVGPAPGARMLLQRYGEGERLGGHRDTFYHDPKIIGERSLLTMQLYLNSDFNGGHLRFCCQDTYESTRRNTHLKATVSDVPPCTGRVVVFQHDCFHIAQPVRNGIKYCIRIDLVYRGGEAAVKPKGNLGFVLQP